MCVCVCCHWADLAHTAAAIITHPPTRNIDGHQSADDRTDNRSHSGSGHGGSSSAVSSQEQQQRLSFVCWTAEAYLSRVEKWGRVLVVTWM